MGDLLTKIYQIYEFTNRQFIVSSDSDKLG